MRPSIALSAVFQRPLKLFPQFTRAQNTVETALEALGKQPIELLKGPKTAERNEKRFENTIEAVKQPIEGDKGFETADRAAERLQNS